MKLVSLWINRIFLSQLAETCSCFDFGESICVSLHWFLVCQRCSVSAGHHQQHHHPQHDLHQNLTQVRSVGGQSGQHRVRPGLLLRGASEQSESGPRPGFSQITSWSPDTSLFFYPSAVCWQVCRVQRSGAVSQREISGEDGVDQLTLTGINHTKPAQTSVLGLILTSSITLSLKRKSVSCFPRLKVRRNTP